MAYERRAFSKLVKLQPHRGVRRSLGKSRENWMLKPATRDWRVLHSSTSVKASTDVCMLKIKLKNISLKYFP
jgi:hypothetical protein